MDGDERKSAEEAAWSAVGETSRTPPFAGLRYAAALTIIGLSALALLDAEPETELGRAAAANAPLEALLEASADLCFFSPSRDGFTMARGPGGVETVVAGRAPPDLLDEMTKAGYLSAPERAVTAVSLFGAAERDVYRVLPHPDQPISERGVCVGGRDLFNLRVLSESETPYGDVVLRVAFASRTFLDDWYAALPGDPLRLGSERQWIELGEATVISRRNGDDAARLSFRRD